MKLKILSLALIFTVTFQSYANPPKEKFSYCSNGSCRLITTNDFVVARGMPVDLNFSCKKNNQYALTFDDGPSENYPRLIEILKKHNVKATFFVIGANIANENANKYYGQMVAAGHFMANHTLNHADLTAISSQEIFDQADKSRQELLSSPSLKDVSPDLLERLKKSTRYVRPPYGNIDNHVDQIFKENGYISVRWNADRYDWNMPVSPETTQTIVNRVVQQLDFIKALQSRGEVFNNSILDLNHDFQNSTMDAIDIYIPLIKARGYEFVTMDECLQ